MSYRIVHVSDAGLRLRRTNTSSIVSGLGVLFAVLFGMVGGGMVLGGSGQSVLIGWAFIVGAAFFSVGPGWIVSQRNTQDPRELVFDNEGAFLAVLQRRPSESPRGFLPYQELAGFTVRAETRRSSGTTASSTTRSYYTDHVVALQIKSGGTWDLMTYRSEAQAAASCALLTGGVRLDRVCGALPPAQLPAHIRRDESDRAVSLTWRNPFSLGMVLFLLLFFATFFSLIFIFSRLDHTGDHSFDWTLKLMAGVGGLVFLGSLWNIWRSAGGAHRVTVDAAQLQVERLDRTGAVESVKSVPIAEVLGIKFDFSDGSGATPLTVWTAEAQAVAARLQSGELSWAAIKAAVGEAPQRLTLDVGMLSVAERLNVENHLNALLRSRGSGPAPRAAERGAFLPHYWWERPSSEEAGSGDFLSGLLSNRAVGVLLMVTAPLPLAVLFAGIFLHKEGGSLAAMVLGLRVSTAVTSALALLVAYRLLRAGAAQVRAGLLGVCTLLALAPLAYGQLASQLAWANLAQVVLSIAAAMALLQLPEEER